jgi:hypothetical protein
MKLSIETLLNPENSNAGACITADMPFKGLYHSLMSLYRLVESDPALVKNFGTLLDDIDIIEKKRNKFIHSIWKIDPNSDIVTRMKFTAKFARGLNFEEIELTISEIDIDTELLHNKSKELLEIIENWENKNKPLENP